MELSEEDIKRLKSEIKSSVRSVVRDELGINTEMDRTSKTQLKVGIVAISFYIFYNIYSKTEYAPHINRLLGANIFTLK